MGNTRRKPEAKKPTRRGRPATTPEARENELISLAHDLTERQMRDGTASAQQITHFLKLGSSRERLEQERMRMEKQLLTARVEQIEAQSRTEELYAEALKAMGVYSGREVEEYDE